MEHMAERMMRWLDDRNMSTAKCAREAGISSNVLYQLFYGRGNISATSLYKICKTHGISADWLLGLEEGR